MKALIGRLRKLEQRNPTEVNEKYSRILDGIRERRRRHLEASGENDRVLPWHSLTLPDGKRLSIGETLRIGRQLARERDLANAGASQK